jgi:exopolyphosphatase / guanosine-5'-triphosphate,3'-diphosphate pyrophosphatase
MGKVNYAAIDIGSNAVRLLIKSIDREAVQEKKIKKVMMLRVPLRLGFDVFSIGELSEKKADKLRRLMKAFRQLMKIYDVDDYRACATSAMRDARNGRTIIKKIEKDTGIRIEIIDGQEEARMIYNNHIECMEDRLGNYMYVDVGGGSTEINLLTNGELVWSVSYNIGTVRMLSNAVKEGTWQQMEEELMKVTEGVAAINIIGSLQTVYDVLKPLTPEERVEAFSLKQDRADVIVPAAEIFLKIAEVVHAEYIYVPVIGLSDGIIDNLYAKSLEKEMKAE